nr:hypothetical protein [Bacilli bacterium]
KKDNEEKTDELEKLKEEVDKLKNENTELTSSLKESHSKEASLSNSIKMEKINKTKNKTKIEELEIENKRVFDSNKQLKTNNKMLKDDNNNLKEEKQELLKELNEARRLIEELKNSNQVIEVPVVVEKVIEKIEPTPVVEEVVETPSDEEITPVIDEVVETPVVEEAKEETVEIDPQKVHELYNINLNDDYYKYFRKQRAIEFSEYLKNHKEKSEDRTEELVNTIAEELYKELTKEVPVKKDEKDKTFYYQEFKKERIEEFSKLNKKDEKKKMNVLAIGSGTSILKEAVKAAIEDVVEDQPDYSEKVASAMDHASFAFSGEKEKKRILKSEKRLKKAERVGTSQLSNKERVEEFRKKMAHKKK